MSGKPRDEERYNITRHVIAALLGVPATGLYALETLLKPSNPLLEEALTAFTKKGLGGLPVCGETCVGGTCNTPGCSCNWPVCTRNTLETQKPNHFLEEALIAFAKKGNLGGLPVCGETCVGGTCNTPGCSCNWPICTRNSLAM